MYELNVDDWMKRFMISFIENICYRYGLRDVRKCANFCKCCLLSNRLKHVDFLFERVDVDKRKFPLGGE